MLSAALPLTPTSIIPHFLLQSSILPSNQAIPILTSFKPTLSLRKIVANLPWINKRSPSTLFLPAAQVELPQRQLYLPGPPIPPVQLTANGRMLALLMILILAPARAEQVRRRAAAQTISAGQQPRSCGPTLIDW
jgi:hypothetical protein